MVRFIPFFVLSEHCVQDSQQLAYTGNQRHFFGFSCGKQSHVKHLYYRVKAGCDKRCHVQGCSYTSPAAKDGSSPSHRARVPVYWNHTDKRTDFTPGEVTLFGYFRQQRSSRHGANTFNTAQSLSKLFEVAMDMAVHVSI